MKFSHSKVTYEINGVKYNRLEDVPAELRALFEDKDNSGVPDVVEDALQWGEPAIHAHMTRVLTEHSSGASPTGHKLVSQLLGRPRAQASITCATCGYDLSGTAVGSKCPECGTDVAATILKLAERAQLFNDAPISSRSEFAIRELRRFVTSIVAVIGVTVIVLLFLKYML